MTALMRAYRKKKVAYLSQFTLEQITLWMFYHEKTRLTHREWIVFMVEFAYVDYGKHINVQTEFAVKTGNQDTIKVTAWRLFRMLGVILEYAVTDQE
jgi:hypothetical protein